LFLFLSYFIEISSNEIKQIYQYFSKCYQIIQNFSEIHFQKFIKNLKIIYCEKTYIYKNNISFFGFEKINIAIPDYIYKYSKEYMIIFEFNYLDKSIFFENSFKLNKGDEISLIINKGKIKININNIYQELNITIGKNLESLYCFQKKLYIFVNKEDNKNFKVSNNLIENIKSFDYFFGESEFIIGNFFEEISNKKSKYIENVRMIHNNIYNNIIQNVEFNENFINKNIHEILSLNNKIKCKYFIISPFLKKSRLYSLEMNLKKNIME